MTVDVDAFRPAEEDVTGRLHRSLPLHDPFAVLLVAALRQVSLEVRGRCLLDLQEQWVIVIASLKQDDERARADAADTDHLPREVHDLEALQQRATVVLKRRAIRPELRADDLVDLLRGDAVRRRDFAPRYDDRRFADDLVLPVDAFGQLRERRQAVPAVRFRQRLLGFGARLGRGLVRHLERLLALERLLRLIDRGLYSLQDF